MIKFGFPTIVTIHLSLRNLTAIQFWSKGWSPKITSSAMPAVC